VNASDLLGKANRAVASARLLLDAGDVDGACNRAEEIRLVADYRGDSVDREHADWMIIEARSFVDAIQRQFMPDLTDR
jgi:uncharacterized protein (UPF0332 family)